MAKVKPFRTKKKTKVYHDNDKCYLGNDIEKENCVHGVGDKRLCKNCQKIDK